MGRNLTEAEQRAHLERAHGLLTRLGAHPVAWDIGRVHVEHTYTEEPMFTVNHFDGDFPFDEDGDIRCTVDDLQKTIAEVERKQREETD